MVSDAKHLVFRFGDFELREKEHRLLRSGEEIHLQPQVFRLLLYLVHNRDRVVQKDEIVREVWDSAAVTDSSLTRSIYLLRKILDDDPADSRAIRTVSSIGYQFVCAVEQAEDGSASSKLTEVAVEEPSKPEAPEIPSAASPAVQNRNPRTHQRAWLLASVVGILALLAAGAWYLLRPLPPPRIAAYTQITHDGHGKSLGGTDGSRLYFTQISPQTIEQIGVNGGEVARVPTTVEATQMILMDVSPDGTNALIGTAEPGHVANPMWVAPLVGGTAKRLGDGEAEVFSADGLSVLYSTAGNDIFLERIDGTENRKLAHVASYPLFYSWSPDRKAIRFTQGDFLWEMSSDGSGLHRLLPDWKEPGSQYLGTWTPDGHFYLFDVGSPSSGSQIWALDERRRPFRTRPSAPIRLTSGPVNWGRLIPSRDGTRIFAEGVTARGELSRVDPKTGVLQPFLGGISAEFVAFSPDGKSVAYVLYPEGTLWKADLGGANRVQLAGGPNYVYNPNWSPDSKKILYSADLLDPSKASIYIVSADGGKPQKLLPEDGAAKGDAYWSPDGKKVAFSQGGLGVNNRDLRILDLGSGQATLVPGSTGMYSPRWSLDGRFITALFADPRPSLPVFDFKTQKWSMLPVSDGVVWFPSFSRDGRYIYFLRVGSNPGVSRIPVTGGKEERVIDMANWHMTGLFSASMSLDPTDAPLVLRDVGSDDIYALTLAVE